MNSTDKTKKTIFVIMPFGDTPSRNSGELSEFFFTNIKKRIEDDNSLSYRYTVKRSDDSFDITSQIIMDLYLSDIVLCDLSGITPNPNVMYELGVRLSLTNRPAILFRENNADNHKVFDIQGFYTYVYNPHKYRELEDYIISNLRKYESNENSFYSPVLKILESEPSVANLLSLRRAISTLSMAEASLHAMTRLLISQIKYYVEDKINPPLSDNVAENIIEITNRKDEFKALDWSDFRFAPTCPKGIEAYIHNNWLNDLSDISIVVPVNTAVMEYATFYFGNAYIYINNNDFISYYSLIAESINLEHIIYFTREYLETKIPEEKADHRKNICEIFDNSTLFNQVLKAVKFF